MSLFNNELDKCSEPAVWQIPMPQPHAEICPICQGTGVLHVVADSACVTKTCHGCGGLGWVTVG
jgi:DnaJ-class molecular chaperone